MTRQEHADLVTQKPTLQSFRGQFSDHNDHLPPVSPYKVSSPQLQEFTNPEVSSTDSEILSKGKFSPSDTRDKMFRYTSQNLSFLLVGEQRSATMSHPQKRNLPEPIKKKAKVKVWDHYMLLENP